MSGRTTHEVGAVQSLSECLINRQHLILKSIGFAHTLGQQITFELPQLLKSVLVSNLTANRCVKVTRVDTGALAAHAVAIDHRDVADGAGGVRTK